MSTILLILAFLAAIGVAKAIKGIFTRRQSRGELKHYLGEEYDEFIRMRKGKR